MHVRAAHEGPTWDLSVTAFHIGADRRLPKGSGHPEGSNHRLQQLLAYGLHVQKIWRTLCCSALYLQIHNGVCVCVCVRVYILKHAYLCAYVRTYVPTYVHAYVGTYVPSYLSTYLPTHIHKLTYFYVCIYVYIYTHMCMCVYHICMFVYAHIYTCLHLQL